METKQQQYLTPEAWYSDAAARRQSASAREIQQRMVVAELMHKSSAEAGRVVTEEMIADEMLLITGRVDREEFEAYLEFKGENGGWS